MKEKVDGLKNPSIVSPDTAEKKQMASALKKGVKKASTGGPKGSIDIEKLLNPKKILAANEGAMPVRKLDPSMYRSDGTIKSAIGWKGPIKNNVTGKTMTELSIGAPNTEEGFYPLINPYTTDEQIEFIKNNNFEGRTQELKKTKIGKDMLDNARRHYEESLEKNVSSFVSYTSDLEEAKKQMKK